MGQTSIKWLIEEMLNKGYFKESVTLTNIDHLQYKAEELHKQEIIDAYLIGQSLGFDDSPRYMADKYYQETFVSKGSDEVKEESLVEKIIPHQLKYNLDVMEKLARISSQQETLYTEEQVQKMIDDALINFGIGYKLANNFVQSLKQPKKD